MTTVMDPNVTGDGLGGGGPAPDRNRRGSAGPALLLALLGVIGAVAVAIVALKTWRGQDLDDRAMKIFSVNGDRSAIRPLVDLLNGVSIGSAALALGVFILLALLRRRFSLAVGAVALVAGANVITQVLKHGLLTRDDLGLGTLNSLPSGHTTVVFSLVLAALLVSPSALRLPVTVVGAALATLTGVGTVVAGWHRPSDVVAAVCVTLAWSALVAAVLAKLASGQPGRGRFFELAGVVGAGIAGLLVTFWGVRPGSGAGEEFAAILALGTIGIATALGTGLFARLTARAVG